ncbi:MAG: hypothetical protein Q9162_006935 [Coniocarpon cinnabarinum]
MQQNLISPASFNQSQLIIEAERLLCDLKQLEELRITDSDSGALHSEYCPPYFSIRATSELRFLRILKLQGTFVDEKLTSFLGICPNLEDVDLWGVMLKPKYPSYDAWVAVFRVLRACESLKHVDLRDLMLPNDEGEGDSCFFDFSDNTADNPQSYVSLIGHIRNYTCKNGRWNEELERGIGPVPQSDGE